MVDESTITALQNDIDDIKEELGLTPQGVYADVRVRLDILESRIGSEFAQATDVENPFFVGNGGVSISTGNGVPIENRLSGSLFLRSDGSAADGLYTRQNNAWFPVGAGGIIVTSLSALAATDGIADGQKAFVQSVKGYFIYASSSTQTIDGRTALATPSAGNTRWIFDHTFSHPDWRIGITDIYIDDGYGTYENQGIYNGVPGSPAPITSKEFYLRWGRDNLITTADLIGLTVQVHILNTISDPLTVVCKLGTDTFLRFLGENSTTLLSSTLTGYTSQNQSTPSGGTPSSITDTAVATFSPYIGKRIRFTATGATAIILKAIAANQARISQPVTVDEPLFFPVPTVVTPSGTAAYVIEDPVAVNLGEWRIISPDGSDFGFSYQTNVADIRITEDSASPTGWMPSRLDGVLPNILSFYRCVWERSYDMTGQNVFQLGCGITGNLFTSNIGIQLSNTCWFGCGIVPNSSAIKVVRIANSRSGPQSFGALDYYTYVQGASVVFEGDCATGAFAVWDAPTHSIYNPGGHGVCVGSQTPDGHTSGVAALSARSGNPIFGSGNAGVGMRLNANSTVTYQIAPNIIGSGGNFQLGNSTTGWWWDATVGTYKPAGAGISLTWANLSAAKGVAGFGDAAHEPDKNAHIAKINTT